MPGQTGKLLEMSDNFCEIFDHGRDLELRNFVRNLLVLVANYRKSRIEKKKKIPHGFATKFTFFVCLFFGGRLRIYYGIFCNYDKEESHSNASY